MENKKHIMLVDDDKAIREMLKDMLEDAGFKVDTMEDGQQAIDNFNKELYQLVITDIIMPEKEGIELIIHLKKVAPEIKIIAISGGGRGKPEDYLLNAEILGADATFTKPFSPAKLLEKVQSLLLNE
ncbi:MAG TPA: response regulator [Bacteroidales bacterium]|nr:response regulator [Bacteroidales bacterium]